MDFIKKLFFIFLVILLTITQKKNINQKINSICSFENETIEDILIAILASLLILLIIDIINNKFI